MKKRIIKEQKEFAKIWIEELKDKNAIKSKIKELEENKNDYIKLSQNYNWNKEIINNTILAYNIIINELKGAI